MAKGSHFNRTGFIVIFVTIMFSQEVHCYSKTQKSSILRVQPSVLFNVSQGTNIAFFSTQEKYKILNTKRYFKVQRFLPREMIRCSYTIRTDLALTAIVDWTSKMYQTPAEKESSSVSLRTVSFLSSLSALSSVAAFSEAP